MRHRQPAFGRRAPRHAGAPDPRPQPAPATHDRVTTATPPDVHLPDIDSHAGHQAIVEAMRAVRDDEAAAAPPEIPRSSRMAGVAMLWGIVLAFGLFLLMPFLPWWAYVGFALLAGSAIYQSNLKIISRQTIVDAGPPAGRR